MQPSSHGNVYDITGLITVTAAVPEPSTWAMMLLGFMGIGFMAYRRRASFRLFASHKPSTKALIGEGRR